MEAIIAALWLDSSKDYALVYRIIVDLFQAKLYEKTQSMLMSRGSKQAIQLLHVEEAFPSLPSTKKKSVSTPKIKARPK